MGIIQTSAGKVWASTVVPCKWELSWTISFLDKRLRQQSNLLGGFKSGRVWKLATNLNPTMGWTPIRKWPSAHNIFGWVETTSCCLNPNKKSSGNPQLSSPQKSPAKIPWKVSKPMWIQISNGEVPNISTPPDCANGRCPWKSRGGGALLPAGTLWRRPRLGYFIWGSVE